MSFLHLSTGILDSSFANCSRSFRFEGCLLPPAVFRSLHRCSMGFRSGLIAGHFRTLQRFVCNHFWVLFEVCFGSLSCWKTHDLWWRRNFLTLATTLHLKILWYHQISWYRSHSQGIQCQKQQSNPKTSLNLHHVWLEGLCSFHWRPHFFFCKQCHDVLYQKALLLSHLSTVRSPRRIVVLSHKFWQNSGVLLGLLP